MDWKAHRNLLAALLFRSIVLGVIILAFDGLLWFDNPKNGHAYALAAFTAISVVLLGLVVAKPRVGFTAAAVWATLQFLMMAADPLSGPQIGISPGEFALYLYGITPISSTSQFSCPFECPPFRYSFAVLLVVQLALAAVAWRARRSIG